MIHIILTAVSAFCLFSDLQSHHEDQSHPSYVSVYTDTLDSRIFCYQHSKLYSREQCDIYSNFRLFTLSLWSYKRHNNILPNIQFSYSRCSIRHNFLTLHNRKGSEDLAYCHSVGHHGFDGACGISPSRVPAVRPQRLCAQVPIRCEGEAENLDQEPGGPPGCSALARGQENSRGCHGGGCRGGHRRRTGR